MRVSREYTVNHSVRLDVIGGQLLNDCLKNHADHHRRDRHWRDCFCSLLSFSSLMHQRPRTRPTILHNSIHNMQMELVEGSTQQPCLWNAYHQPSTRMGSKHQNQHKRNNNGTSQRCPAHWCGRNHRLRETCGLQPFGEACWAKSTLPYLWWLCSTMQMIIQKKYAEHRDFLGQWNYSVWYGKGEFRSLCTVQIHGMHNFKSM